MAKTTATDAFFQQMVDNAKILAKKEVRAEMAKLKKDLAKTRKELRGYTTKEAKLKKAEAAALKAQKDLEKREKDLKAREDEVTLATNEIVYLMDQFDKLKDETQVVTTVSTKTARTMIHPSKGGTVHGVYATWYDRHASSLKSKALARIRNRAKKGASKSKGK